MIPGSNLLSQALSIIGSQRVRYYRATGRSTSATGRDVTTYADPQDVLRGSVQAVPRTRYAAMGLDYSRAYKTWFVMRDVVGVERDKSGDEFEHDGRRYKVEAVTAWYAMDGWNEVLGIDIGAAAP